MTMMTMMMMMIKWDYYYDDDDDDEAVTPTICGMWHNFFHGFENQHCWRRYSTI